MTQDEIIEMARDAGLRIDVRGTYFFVGFGELSDLLDAAITKEREALAKEQEPVAWVSEDVCEGQYIDGRPRKIWWECEKGVGTAFYTTPPQRTEQEPVALQYLQKDIDWQREQQIKAQASTPPQRTWVGLEGEEIRNLWEEATKPDRSTMTMVTSFAKSIEAKLKEKNT